MKTYTKQVRNVTCITRGPEALSVPRAKTIQEPQNCIQRENGCG